MQALKAIYQESLNTLTTAYEPEECRELALLLVSVLSGCTRSEILANKEVRNFDIATLKGYLQRLLQYEPVQYILGFTYFYGLKFMVNPSVFIPRPETEELVELILKNHQADPSLSILDIGTGSGCIPISLAVNLPQAKIYAIEVSDSALQTAQLNAVQNHATVHFIQHDINHALEPTKLPVLDVIVSNPPYITVAEKDTLQQNVVAYEPHVALFTTADDPIHFYKKIVRAASQILKPMGALYFEINQQLGSEVAAYMSQNGFINIQILKDINNNDRFVTGVHHHK